MRIVLTFIAVILAAALSAALVVPLFIDWSGQRAFVERQLSERLGAPVSIAGPIDIRFLPTPYLTASRVSVGRIAAGSEPALACQGMRLELTLGGLFDGQIRFSEIDLNRPVLTLERGLEASMPGLSARFAGLADRVALDRLVVEKGLLKFAVDGGAPLAFADIDIDASARSLKGPFRGAGALSTPAGGRVQLQFASSEIARAALPIKAEFDWGAGGPRASFDGALRMAASAGSPEFAGAATVSGSLPGIDAGAPTPWRISGGLLADRRHAKLDGLDLRLGPEERALEIGGSAQADFGEEVALDAQLSAKTLNLDSLLRREGEDAAPPARMLDWLKAIGGAFAGRGGPPLRLDVGFSTPLAFLGAQTLEQVDLGIASRSGEPLTGRFATGLPGHSRVVLSGALELGAAAQFGGRMEARIGDFGVLKDWAAESEPELASSLSAVGDVIGGSDASATGDITVSSVGFSARNLALSVDRSKLTGAVTYTAPVAAERARLAVDLRSDALDIDAAPDLSASAGWFGDFDFSLDLEATRFRIARVGDSALDTGSLVLKATKTGAKVSLDRLSVENLGGATIEARGESSPSERWGRLRLDAAHLRDFAALVARLAPGTYSRMLVERADALSPARASLEARREGPALDGPFPLDFLKAEGEAGPTKFSLELSNAPAPVGAVSANFTLDAADGAALLRQLGAKPSSGPNGSAHFAASASGKWEAGFDARLEASLANANLTWKGRFVPVPVAPDDRILFGAASLQGENLLIPLSMFGLAPPAAAVVAPIELSADFVLRGAEASLPRIAGTIAGARVSGNLAWRRPTPAIDVTGLDPDLALARSIAGEAPLEPAAQISGNISLDHSTLGGLLALPLGPPGPVKAGGRWSDAPFAQGLLRPPPTDVRLRIGALELGDGLPAQNFNARLQMSAGKFDFDEIAVDVAGGKASGRLTLRRDGPIAALDGRLGLASIRLERASLRGLFGASLAIAGTGQSPNSLISGLVGEGHVNVEAAMIPRMDPRALGRVVAKAKAPDAPIDETNIARSLTLELDRQPLALPDGQAAATLNSGVLKVGPVSVANPGGRALMTADLDLRSLNLQIRTSFEEAGADKFWSGPPPSATVSIHGALDAPVRRIDVAALAAGLATAAIARESDRIATLEADMRERAYFNRVLKASRFLGVRAAEIAAYQAEQERLKYEADRRRVEASALKAYEDRMKAGAKPSTASDVDPKSPPEAKPAGSGATPDPTGGGLY